jgi:cysteine desulfurase
MKKEGERLKGLRDKLEGALINADQVFVNGNTLHRLPNISNLSFKDLGSDELMIGLNKNIALSSGSACTSASIEPSHVLKALALDDELAQSSIRFGLGRFNTEVEIDYTIDQVKEVVLKLREAQLAN